VSTISRAFARRRLEEITGDNPDAILERNARYREAMRENTPADREGRRRFVVAALFLGAAFILLLVILPGIVDRPGAGLTARPAAVQPTLPPANPADTPQATPASTPLPIPTPYQREEVRLRTRPLLRPASEGFPAFAEGAGANEVPPAYVAGMQPIVLPEMTPPPIETPVPRAMLPKDMSSISASGRTSSRTSSSTSRAGEEDEKAAAAKKANPVESLALTGIIMDGPNSTALINDQILKPGETVQGVRIVAIDNSSTVRVEFDGKQYTLQLK
jgi:hypothetical protein